MPVDCSTKTALCLDDEVLVALNHADTISDIGFGKVHIAHNIAKATHLLDDGPIDLALLDINLGQGETTFDIARAVQAQGGTVIFASGYGTAELPPDLASTPLVEKPTSLKCLARLIRQILEESAARVSPLAP